MKATLLILAAGMGSRYGGLKQMDEFGPNGETILDYSIYDAMNAGFTKVVFVIRDFFKEEFIQFFDGKFNDRVEVVYVTQELHMVPKGCEYDIKREKPWGTAHAIWVARDVINEPFAVINADDYYGKESFVALMDFLKSNEQIGEEKYSLVGYKLINTLSKHGTVNRGVCSVNKNDELAGIVETLKIGFTEDNRIAYPHEDGHPCYLEPDTLVSMNMWGFYPSFFSYAEEYFRNFVISHADNITAEFFIPLLIDKLTDDGDEMVEVLSCDAEWFGVTYKEDKPFVVEKLNRLIEAGKYPLNLWENN